MELRYLKGYPSSIIDQIVRLIEQERLIEVIQAKYPACHQIKSDSQLYSYVGNMKQEYLRQSDPLSKVMYDEKLDVLHRALGLHTSISRVQGSKLKNKQEIRIGGVFRHGPEPFLRMIVTHELAHLREREHNKSFYRLCERITPDYHRLELDCRVYLTCLEEVGEVYR
jgi:UTP pyrophosphatase